MRKKFLILLCVLLLSGIAAAETDGEDIDLLKVDHRLYELGYRDENCNGQLDEPTVSAIKNFQLVNGLEVTGDPDEQTVALLMSDEAKTEAEYLSSLADSYRETNVLSRDAVGNDVRRLQMALKALGYFDADCDGAYGDATEAAVYRFQLAIGIEGNGVADGSVQNRLFSDGAPSWTQFLEGSIATAGDSGSHVRMLQMRLKKLGYFQGTCTGQYGEGTQSAVRSFQANNALEVNGIANAATCGVLYSNRAAVAAQTYEADPDGVGQSASEIIARLTQLGYPAGDKMNAQTEIAVMEFQLQSGMAATGTPDADTKELLLSEAALSKAPAQEISVTADQLAQVGKIAQSLLGKKLEFADSSELVVYIYLKAGVLLTDDRQMPMQKCESMDDVQAGDVVMLDIDGNSVCGIATSDGAVIYCGHDGYVVMSYPDPQGEGTVFHWRAALQTQP